MRKKLLLTLLGVFSMLPATALEFEYTYEGQTLRYSTNAEAQASVRAVDQSISGDLIIPEIVEHQGIVYTVTSIGYEGFSGCASLKSVILPETIVYIDYWAFSNCSALTSATLPNSVTAINNGLFYQCTSLVSVTLPEGISSIGSNFFTNCSSLTTVNIPETVTSLPPQAFYGCSSLTSVTLPESLTSIGDGAFENSGLTSVIVPSSVTSMGDYVFRSCRDLTSVILPETLTSIGNSAFSGCSSLTSINLPETLTSIGNSAFYGCSSLTSIIIPERVVKLGQGVFRECFNLTTAILKCKSGNKIFEHRGTVLKILYPSTLDGESLVDMSSSSLSYNVFLYPYEEGCDLSIENNNTVLTDNGKTLFMVPSYIEDYVIPDGVETITSRAFEGCNTTKTLTIPASVKVVEAGAFKTFKFDGWNFTEPGVWFIEYLERVNFIDWNAWCENVALGDLDSNPYRYGAEVYAGGVRITASELREGMTEIKDYINCGLEGYRDEVELPTTLKRIGAYAFYNNKELYHVFLNDNLEEIGEHAFDGCELLENQTFPSTLNKIEEGAYKDCTSLTEVVLPENLSSLGANVFEGCSALEKAVLVANIDYIPDYAFNKCTALSKLYLPLQLKSIGDYTFADCEALDEIKLPASLETIGNYAFYDSNPWNGLGSITQLNIPDKVTSIGKHSFHDQSIQNLTIGKGLTTISESAFEGNPLKSVNLSEGLEKIERNAFSSGRDRISSVVVPTTVKEIEENAFGETAIQELVIPDGILTLPYRSCGSPALLTIGKDVKTIDANAFSFDNLITFRLKATMPPTLNEAFPITNDQNDKLTLVVNSGRVVSYMNNARWKQINRIIQEDWTDVVVYLDGTFSLAEEIRMQNGLMPSQVNKMKVVGPLDDNDLRVIRENMVSLRSLDLSEVSNVTEIPDGQFKESLLNEIVLPNGVERIGNEAFANCQLLTMTELPETINSIGNNAFRDCIRVTFSRMPENLIELGDEAFRGCTAIKEMTFNSQFNGSLPYSVFFDCSQLERVDLSATEIYYIEDGAFRGCYELDEIILPEILTKIGNSVFYGTAIRDISFIPEKVNEIGEGVFSNCRRLVAATLPQRMIHVSSNIFADCKRLLAVSMPAGITSVGHNLVDGDKKLSNISCAANDAPEAETGAFDNIRLRYVSLTVPQLSFRSYLSAPQWGRFETIQNRIPVSIGKGVEVTNVAEDEYKDMLEEDRLEELQEAASKIEEKEENPEEQPENVRRRAARRSAARAITNRSFAALFDGAQIQTGNDGSGTRIFINPEEGVNVTSVKLDGEEMLDKMEGNSLLLPAGTKGSLEILTDMPNIGTGIEEIVYDETSAPIYTLTGTMVGRGRGDLDNLQPGIYIFCGRKIAVK